MPRLVDTGSSSRERGGDAASTAPRSAARVLSAELSTSPFSYLGSARNLQS